MTKNIVAERDTKNVSDILSNKISYLMNRQNINRNSLARVIGLPVMTIKRLITGETADPRISTLKLLADHFGVSLDFLINPNAKLARYQITDNLIKIPIIDWKIIKNCSSNINVSNIVSHKNNFIYYQTSNNEILKDDNLFAIESPDYALQKSILVISTKTTPKHHDIVLLRNRHNNDLCFKIIIKDGDRIVLRSLTYLSHENIYNADYDFIGFNILKLGKSGDTITN